MGSLKSVQKSTTDATIEKTLHSEVQQLDQPSTSKASSMPPDINLLDDDKLPPVETEIVLIIDSDEENNETKREKEARKINKRADLRDALAQISNDDILTEQKEESEASDAHSATDAISNTDDTPTFKVKKIVNSKYLDGIEVFKCRYTGLGPEADQWQSLETMEGETRHNRKLIKKYHEKRIAKRNTQK